MEHFTITLQGIELYGHHGLYPGEKELGAKYKVEVVFELLVPQKEQLELHDTVDYKKAYDIVVEIFKVPTPLLENICKKLANRFKKEFLNATSVSVAISKLSPPLGGISEAAKVLYVLK